MLPRVSVWSPLGNIRSPFPLCPYEYTRQHVVTQKSLYSSGQDLSRLPQPRPIVSFCTLYFVYPTMISVDITPSSLPGNDLSLSKATEVRHTFVTTRAKVHGGDFFTEECPSSVLNVCLFLIFSLVAIFRAKSRTCYKLSCSSASESA